MKDRPRQKVIVCPSHLPGAGLASATAVVTAITLLWACPAAGDPAPASRPGTSVRWRVERFASTIWIVDQLSQWDREQTSARYLEDWQRRHGQIDARGQQLLASYARLRRRLLRPIMEQVDVRRPIDLLPPRQLAPGAQLTVDLLDSDDLEQALRRQPEIGPDDRRLLAELLSHFGPRIAPLLGDASHLPRAAAALRRLAATARLQEYLGRAARFYGVERAAGRRVTVHLLWAPDSAAAHHATQIGPHVLIPITSTVTARESQLAAFLGMIVHELGHHFASLLPESTRDAVNARLFDRHGIINRGHPNVIDEATQTALGNIHFMRTRLAEHHDAYRFYGFETDAQYPYAIDSLAREIEPHLARLLHRRGAFASALVDLALSEQARLFGEAPRHHAAVCLVLGASRRVNDTFGGLFGGLSRWSFTLAEARRFARFSRQNLTIPRWALLTLEAARQRDVARHLAMAQLSPLVRHLDATPADAACLLARRRRGDRGHDFAVVARDLDAMRRMLIAIHGQQDIPRRQPRCIPAASR